MNTNTEDTEKVKKLRKPRAKQVSVNQKSKPAVITSEQMIKMADGKSELTTDQILGMVFSQRCTPKIYSESKEDKEKWKQYKWRWRKHGPSGLPELTKETLLEL